MSRFVRVPHEGLAEGDLELAEAALHYVTRVHRLGRGDVLTLFDATTGMEAEAELLDERVGRVRVAACRTARKASLPVSLLSALGKGDKPEQVVRDAAALGAARVIFLQSERSVARGAGSERPARFARIAVETARQCGRSDVPVIAGPLPLDTFLAEPRSPGPLRLVACRVAESRPLLRVVADAQARLGAFPETEVLIGPEGGLSPREIALAREQGFLPVGLGPLVLRTEVACGAVLAGLWLFADGLRD
jgi:16S rRNA (uracil1498-N3)-methyltransferase